MSKINRMSQEDAIKYLLDKGLLFEINRQILHPLGLALEIEVNDDGIPIQIGGLWDYRDDPEGMTFEESTFDEGFVKFSNFMDEYGAEVLIKRKELLGFVVQESAV